MIYRFSNFIKESVEDIEVNRILDKISANGIDSLSNYEKSYLDSRSDDSIAKKSEYEVSIFDNAGIIMIEILKDGEEIEDVPDYILYELMELGFDEMCPSLYEYDGDLDLESISKLLKDRGYYLS